MSTYWKLGCCKVMKGIEKRLKDSMCERVNNI